MGYFSNNPRGVTSKGFTVKGDKALIKTLNKLAVTTRKRVLRKGVRAAAKPMLKKTRSLAPERTGALKRSFITKVKTYKSGTVVAIVGPSAKPKVLKATKSRGAMKVDAYYAHMVEGGVARHLIRVGGGLRGMTIESSIRREAFHGGFRGKHFMRRAAQTTLKAAAKAFSDKTWTEIEREGMKAARLK